MRDNSPEKSAEQLIDEVEKLIWDFLDDHIEETDAKRLEELLKENEQARIRYLQCAEIHANLYEHYRTGTQPEVKSPVLGSLGSFLPSPADHSHLTD